MITKSMDNRTSQNIVGIDNSFSAVLEEIYKQTQKEIEAQKESEARRNRNQLVNPFPSQTPVTEFGSSCTYDPIGRYEPLLDPALSFISGILAEDDEPTFNHPFLTRGDFDAYQAKATEVAAILKEDSPALALKIESGTPQSPDDGSSTSVSEDSYVDPITGMSVAYTDPESPLSVGPFSEVCRNEILLNSLRGPINRPFMFQEVTSSTDCSISVNGKPLGASRSGSQDDIGLKSNTQRTQRSEKTGRGLKPRKENMRKKSGGKSRSAKDGEQECVELNDLLIDCATAIGLNNTKRAIEILKKVRQYASPYGNGAERLAYYFAEGMDARFSGTGWPLYLGLLKRRPSAAEVLKAVYMYMECCPFVRAYHYFINHTILNAAQGANKLYILELQIDGFQYPALFEALSRRPGGPPEVHLIGLGFPHYSMLPARTDIVLEAVEKTGRQLAEYAAKCKVPFKYTAWAGTRDKLQMQDFVSPYRSEGEVLVVISASLLRYVMDDNLDSPIVRSKLLKQGRDINPEVYIQGIVTGSYSTPFFVRRFKEALFHFESVFDMLDTFISRENTDRLVFESELLGKAILNIVACEGSEVVDRIDKYKHWQLVTEEVGFKQLPLNEEIKKNVHRMLGSWSKEYTAAEDSQYLLMGWKGRMLHAMSTWNATPENV